jgi:hypothetical protein
MAHAAMFMSNTGDKQAEMCLLGTKLQLKAMAELRIAIANGTVDYIGLLTTMLTLLFIEVWSRSNMTYPFKSILTVASFVKEPLKRGDTIFRPPGSFYRNTKLSSGAQAQKMHGM